MDGLDSGAALMLHECCFYKVPALVLDPESDLVWQARFESISKESVTLHLFEESNRSFEPSRLFVSFYGNCCSFFATVLEYQSNTPPLPSNLTLQLSSEIVGMERRNSYRVPIGKKIVPRVCLSTADNRTLLPKPRDLSLTGMKIEFDEAEDPGLSPSAEVRSELSLDGHVVSLKSVIKHRDDHRYHLFFPETITEDGIDAPPPLQKIVETLERTVLHERVLLNRHN